jgi:hypothetical protein
MSNAFHILANGDLLQSWGNAGFITVNDDWSAVPSIQGFLGQNITTVTATDPQTLTTDSALANDFVRLAYVGSCALIAVIRPSCG